MAKKTAAASGLDAVEIPDPASLVPDLERADLELSRLRAALADQQNKLEDARDPGLSASARVRYQQAVAAAAVEGRPVESVDLPEEIDVRAIRGRIAVLEAAVANAEQRRTGMQGRVNRAVAEHLRDAMNEHAREVAETVRRLVELRGQQLRLVNRLQAIDVPREAVLGDYLLPGQFVPIDPMITGGWIQGILKAAVADGFIDAVGAKR